MSHRANPTLIGAFVAGGLALAVAGTLFFGSGNFFSSQKTFVLYFSGSVNGLEIGSPVKFKGVPIGEVTDIRINYNQIETNVVYMPVFIQVDEGTLEQINEGPLHLSSQTGMEYSIRHGLRAKLETESILTGRLYVDLDLYPEASPPVFLQREERFPEIPTVSSPLAKLVKSLGKIDLQDFTRRVESILKRVDDGLGEIEFATINRQVVAALDSLNALLNSPNFEAGLRSISSMSEEARALLARVDQKIDPLTNSVLDSMGQFQGALGRLQGLLEDVNRMVAADSPLSYEIGETMREFREAARSVRLLADLLNRNPKSILTGRKTTPAP